MDIYPQISILAHEFNLRYICAVVSNIICQGTRKDGVNIYIKICIKSYFNQINTFQNIVIKFK
jgi:hypothetical protein